MICGVYLLTTPSGNRYVGSSLDAEARYRSHKSDAQRGRHCNQALQRAFDKHGELRLDVLEECPPERRLDREQYYIDTLKPELNASGLASGVEFTPTVRAKIAAGWTEERRAETSQRMRGNRRCVGRKDTPEINAKRSASLTGRVRTEEHRRNISKAQKRRFSCQTLT